MRLIYAVFDKKAKAYGPVIGASHDAVATRDFGAACADPNSNLNRYPQDFELHCVASMNDYGVAAREVVIVGCEPRVVVTAEAVRDMSAGEEPQRLKVG